MANQPTVADIKGNAPDNEKQMCINVLRAFGEFNNHFAHSVGKRTKLEEINIGKVVNGKSRVSVVCSIIVDDDMLNIIGTMHGGCTAYLIDACSSIAISIDPNGSENHEDWWGRLAVSQALNVIYHSPPRKGSTLRIVSETIVVGGRMGTVQCEIWDSTRNKLVATGTHTKMPLRNVAIGKL